jgi:DNA-binding response OmpR family regulator
MLPDRAYTNHVSAKTSDGAQATTMAGAASILLVGFTPDMADRAVVPPFIGVTAATTADARAAIERAHPAVVTIDWDADGVDGQAVCAAARQATSPGVLAVLSRVEMAPLAIKAGAHAVLLRPFAPNLLAARLGRLCRATQAIPPALRSATSMRQAGTNRVWPDTRCPRCSTGDAVSFDFSSYRRMWYACLACDCVWLGARQER